MSEVKTMGKLFKVHKFGNLRVGDWFISVSDTVKTESVYIRTHSYTDRNATRLDGFTAQYAPDYEVYKVDADVFVKLAKEDEYCD